MDKDITRFRGSLEGTSLNTITTTKVNSLLDKNIIVQFEYDEDLNKTDYEKYEDDKNFDIYFFFNMREYMFNEDIIHDIYDLMMQCIRRKHYNILQKEMTEIRIKCRSLIDISSKVNYLKTYHKNLFENPSDFDYYETFIDKEKARTFFLLIVDENNFFGLVKFYLNSLEMKESHHTLRPIVINKFTNEENPFISKWILYHKTRTLETFILNMIKRLEPSDHNDEKKDSSTQKDQKSKTLKSQTPLYQVLFIDQLRKLKNESYYSDDNLEKYLGHLTGYDFKEKKIQIDDLRDIIHLEDFEYKKFSAFKLGEKIHDITNKDLNSLRRNSAVITKKQKDFTKKQKEKFKNKYELEDKIRRVIKTIG